MKQIKRKYFKSFCVYLIGYMLLYLLPLLFYLQLPDSMRDLRFEKYFRWLPLYSAVWLIICGVHAAVRYSGFLKQVGALSPAAVDALEGSIGRCKRYKLRTGTIYLCDRVFYYTGGTIAEYPMIKEIEIRKSETDKLDVIHMYVYLHDGTKSIIPIGLRTLPESFEADIKEKHPSLEISRTYKPAFGRKRNINEEKNNHEK